MDNPVHTQKTELLYSRQKENILMLPEEINFSKVILSPNSSSIIYTLTAGRMMLRLIRLELFSWWQSHAFSPSSYLLMIPDSPRSHGIWKGKFQ